MEYICKLIRRFDWLVLLVSLGYVAEFTVLAGLRLFYPYELEWIEGANVDEIRWIMQGGPLYSEPSIFFIPLAYNPFFFFLSAVLMKFIGVGFVAPRLISVLSTLGCFLLLFLIVARDSHPKAGVIAAGVYAASFRFTGAWMDLAKVDSLFLFLVLAAFFTARQYPNYWGMVVSGLLYVLAYYTKQVALPIIAIMAPLSLILSKGRTWLQWLTVVVFGFVVFGLLESTSGGWFSFYSIKTLTYHARIPDLWFFWRSLIERLWPALLIGLSYFILTLLANETTYAEKSKNFWMNLCLVVALVFASWSIFLKVWTYDNGFMPASAGLGILAGLGYGRTLSWQRSSLFRTGIAILLLFQFAALFYNPLSQLPTNEDKQAAERFINRVRDLPGEVLVFNHGYVNYLAGKNTYFHSVPYGDVIGGVYPPRTEDDRQRIDRVRDVIRQSIKQQIFDWVIVDKSPAGWFPTTFSLKDHNVI
jgi:hypothetical protein